jgi:hypothetical protein
MFFSSFLKSKTCMDMLLTALCLSPLVILPFKIWENVEYYNEHKGHDEGVKLDERLRVLRSVVGPCELVGYVSDIDPVKDHDRYWMEAKYMSYALAPAFVDEQRLLPLVVGNFYTPALAKKILEERGLRVLYDLGNGVMLLKWEGQR